MKNIDKIITVLKENELSCRDSSGNLTECVYSGHFRKVAEELVKLFAIPAVSGSILAKAEMINALTNTMKVNKETLGEYYVIRDKALEKLKAALDDV